MSEPDGQQLRFDSRTGRLLLLVTILASGMAFLDSTVVTVALPKIEADLGGGFSTLQWVLDGYLLTLGSLVLVGGALGDRLGRRRVLLAGVVLFTVTSVLCGLAVSPEMLMVARALQGVAAALMIPGSLALISMWFAPMDRGRAIGAWSGLTSLAMVLGPFIGGLLVDLAPSGWRWVFLINVPIAVVVLILSREVPADTISVPRSLRTLDIDVLGAALTVGGLMLIVGPLIEWGQWPAPVTTAAIAIGAALLVSFWFVETHRERRQRPPPMMPTSLWRIGAFRTANLVTFFVYGALGAMQLSFAVGLQIGLGWSALAAGAAGAPMSLVLALLSARIGGLLPRFGSRNLLTIGAALMAGGMAWLSALPEGANYLVDVLPPLLLLSVGLAFVVAPITTTALGDIPVAASGVGSGVNNAVARVAGLVAVAVVPLLSGLTDVDASSGAAALPGYRRAMLVCSGLLAVAALLSWFAFGRQTGRVAEPPRDGERDPSGPDLTDESGP